MARGPFDLARGLAPARTLHPCTLARALQPLHPAPCTLHPAPGHVHCSPARGPVQGSIASSLLFLISNLPQQAHAARTSFRRQGRLYWQCGACQHQCSVTSGTIFESTKLPLSLWFLAMQLLTQAKNNVSALELHRQVGVSYRTAWLMKHKLLEVMRQREDSRQLTGRVEIDDAYLGGQRSGGKAHLACLSQRPFTKASLDEFMAKSLALPLTAVSDGLGCFTVVAGQGAVHDRTVTGGGKDSVKLPQFNAVNTLLGNLKTALTGTYHAVKFAKYAHRYLAEVQYRFNRRYDLRSILGRLVRAAVATTPQPEIAIRRAEVHC